MTDCFASILKAKYDNISDQKTSDSIVTQTFKDMYIEEQEIVISNFVRADQKYPYGFNVGIYLEEDRRLRRIIFPYIEKNIAEQQAQAKIVSLYRDRLAREKKSLEQQINNLLPEERTDFIKEAKLKIIHEKLDNVSFDNMLMHFSESHTLTLEMKERNGGAQPRDAALLGILKILRDEFAKAMMPLFGTPKVNFLETFYLSKGLDLHETDRQYNKYGLLSVGDFCLIKCSNWPKIYDDRVKTHVFIEKVKPEIVDLLKQLRDAGFVGDIAFRPNCYLVADSLPDYSYALEELERGEVFSFKNLGKPKISKLYSLSGDNLWIDICENEITFEEITSNFDTDGDSIITTVVHLEYEQYNSDWVITHLDHEYVFYTFDEFCKRQADPHQKGSDKTRYKTFKVDNSKIPFMLDDGRIPLYIMLNSTFQNKDLLKEYFEKCI